MKLKIEIDLDKLHSQFNDELTDQTLTLCKKMINRLILTESYSNGKKVDKYDRQTLGRDSNGNNIGFAKIEED